MINHPANGCCPGGSAGLGAVTSIEEISGGTLGILYRRRWTVLAASLFPLASAGLYLLLATPLYTSTSRICVELTGPQVLERDSSGMIARWDSYLYTQGERLRSTQILSAAVSAAGLANLRTFAGVEDPVGVIHGALGVVVGKRDEIIDVSFASPYPDEAAAIVNAVTEAYIRVHDERKRSMIRQVVEVLQEERAQCSQELHAKVEKMVEFAQQNESPSYGMDQYTDIILQRVERLSAALTEAQLTVVESKSFYEAVKRMVHEPTGLRQLVEAQRAGAVYVATANEASALRAELNRKERDKADLLRELEPNHWAIAAVDAEMEQTRKQIDVLEKDFAQGQLAAAEQQYLLTQGRESELQKHLREEHQQVILLSRQLAQYILLESDYEQTKEFCNLLNDSIHRLDLRMEASPLNISVLEAAVPALSPSRPDKVKTIGFTLCIGLLAGAGLALIREWKDERLRSPRESALLLVLPVLGGIPAMGWTRQASLAHGQRIRTEPNSREAEAFRTLRTAVSFRVPKEQARTIAVVSPTLDEDRSTVVSNLGIAMAQTGQRVLIIDANLRRPMQHKIFQLDQHQKGLSAVLAGRMSLENAIERTSVENVEVLTCGPNVPNLCEMLHRVNYAQVLEKLPSTYDRILVDSSPVTAAADALILAALCDATILVLQAGVSTRRTAMQCREALAGVNARVMGIVINDVSHDEGYYPYYSRPTSPCCYGYGGNGCRSTAAPESPTVPAIE